jgi:S1-C subfamily serine protease
MPSSPAVPAGRNLGVVVAIVVGCVLGFASLFAAIFYLLPDTSDPKVVAQTKALAPTPTKITPKPALPPIELPPETVISFPRDDANVSAPETPDGRLTAETLQKVKDATVFITVSTLDGSSLTGSGFLALGPGLVLTNAHVLDMKDPNAPGPEQLHVTLWSGEPRETRLQASVLGVDREADLALLRFFENEEYEKTKMPAPLAIIKSINLRETQRVFVFGFPLADAIGKNVTVTETSVSSLRKPGGKLDQVQVNGNLQPGNAGGPVVNSGGNVVGIAVTAIRGAQISFAIPCEHVFDFIAGRVLSAKAGEANPVGTRFEVGVSLKVSDPLYNIKKLELEWWQGRPGDNRPASLNRPEPKTGDGERHTLSASFDANRAVGETGVPLAGLPAAGQVLWVQPVLWGRDGKPSWGAASAHKILPAPTSTSAVLARKASPDKLPMHLTVRSSVDERGATVLNTTNTYMLEESLDTPPAGAQNQRLLISRGEHELAMNGRPSPTNPQEQQFLGLLANTIIDLQIDAAGNLTKTSADLKNVAGTTKQKEFLKAYLDHVRIGVEALAVPLPAGSAEPGQKWQAVRPLSYGLMETTFPANFAMTYSFRGVRTEEGREVGVLQLAGTLTPYRNNDRELTGSAGGEAIIDLATGQVVREQCTLDVVHRMLFQNASYVVARHNLQLSLTLAKNSR